MILKETFPHLRVYINGGIVNLEDLNELLAVYGGVMLGRKIYADPMFLNDIEKKIFKKVKRDFLVSKFDLINTWQGTVLYFVMLVLALFILKRYFFFNVNVIEIQNIEKKIIDK